MAPRQTRGRTARSDRALRPGLLALDRWKALSLGLVLALVALGGAAAAAEDIRFFRIGTAATTGTYFAVGGAIANAISKPPGSRDCDRGGSCGVPGLVAVAQATQGSVENVDAVAAGRLESALVQSDIAYWANTGTGLFKNKPPLRGLRAIAGLFPESVHLVVRADGPIRAIKDLKGKRVSLGEKESGTLVEARLILEAAGLPEREVKGDFLRLSQAADALARGELDAFFLFGGYPVPAIAELAATTPIRLVPIAGEVAERLTRKYRFFAPDIIPGSSYRGLNADTPTIGTRAFWIVGASVPESLVYDITKALWNDHTRRILDAGHPMGQRIKIGNALDGLTLPLHPGAQRYYREVGLPIPAETQ